MTDWSKERSVKQPLSWKTVIDEDQPGADYFLSSEPGRFDPVEYFKSRGATSSRKEMLTFEWANWMTHFSNSSVKRLQDISIHLRSRNKLAQTQFWENITYQERLQKQKQRLMDTRRLDLRKQNINQLRSDGVAMTRELDEELNAMASSSGRHRDEVDEDKEESPVISVDIESSGIPKHGDFLQNFSDTSDLKPGSSMSKTPVHSSDPTDSTTSSATRSYYARAAAPDLSKRKVDAAGVRLPEPWRSLIETAKALVSNDALICLGIYEDPPTAKI
ncbi:hypothetical protein BGX20_005931 [Mortierella sp. AD010]|nr:hypothetical protein BGX20_005931 [Mortierella sp. AD010]